jgi:hypothetical protein
VAATYQNFELYSGNALTVEFTVYQNDGRTPFNLSGASAIWRLCSLFDPAPVITKTIGAGLTITNAAAGIVSLSLSSSDTDPLGSQPYRHELEVIDGSGNPTTVTTGTVMINQSLFQ